MLSHRTAVSPQRRAGFTLVELMIVIVIISVLAAFLVPALARSRVRAQIMQVRMEISALEQAIADFKSVYGVEPPSSITMYESAAGWTATATGIRSRALVRRIWPQFTFAATDFNSDGDTDDTYTLTGAECLVFFLGGMRDSNGSFTGFSKNPTTPFAQPASGSTATRVGPFYEFPLNRLTDLDGDLVYEFRSSLPDQSVPYLYLSSYEGTGYNTTDLSVYDPSGSNASLNMTSCYMQTASSPWKSKSFQLIAPGLDNLYGAGGIFDSSTAGSVLTGTRSVERDNITSFHTGMLVGDK